jgi:serine/threonine-protein kinase
VIPRSLSVPRLLPVNEGDENGGDAGDPVNRTSRFEQTSRFESGPPAPPRRGSRPRRGMFAIIAAVVLVLGLGAGVWYINSGQFTKVPLLLAKTEAQAKTRIEQAGLDVGQVKHAYSDTVKRGTVISSDPAPGARIRDNDSVTLTISNGPETVKVPDLTGLALFKAREVLKANGLAAGMVTREFNQDVLKGFVISSDPGAGTERHAGSAIALTVSKGSPVEVADVTGASVADATSELEQAGLKVKIATQRVNSEFDQGQIAQQSPKAGSQLADGDTVTLTVSKGPEMVSVPDVVGDSVDDAKKTLEDAGFQVDEDRGLLGLFGDHVKSQSVEGGKTAPKGSTISIVIR